MNYTELELYLKQLFNSYLNKYNISVEDKQDAIQNTLLKIYEKELDGIFSSTSIEENKNYIFITIRNEVFKHMNNTKRKHSEYTDELDVENGDDILDVIDFQQKKELVLRVINNNSFNPTEISVITDIFNGNKASDLQEKYNLSRFKLNQLYSYAKKKIKYNLSKKPRYMVVYKNKNVYCFNQKQLLQETGLSPDTWTTCKKLNKLNFSTYKIQILK